MNTSINASRTGVRRALLCVASLVLLVPIAALSQTDQPQPQTSQQRVAAVVATAPKSPEHDNR